MEKKRLIDLKQFYQSALLDDVIPFWLKHGVDYEQGGYLTSLDQKGNIYNYDKSVWFQGRTLYILSKLIEDYEENEEWRKAADCGYDFLKKCFFEDGRMPFTVTRDGMYIQKRRYYFSETFAVIALAQYFIVTKEEEALLLAKKTYDLVLKLYRQELLTQPKFNTALMPTKTLAVPMIVLSTTQALRRADAENEGYYNKVIDECISDIKDFVHPEYKAVFENVKLNGELFLESPKGRLLNPGHAIEAGWFILNEAGIRNDIELQKLGINIIDWSFEKGWDKEYGGLMYFVDIEGKPLEQLEWDMKLWWPHNEALIAFIMAYAQTGEEKHLDNFMKVHDYSFHHFSDKIYGEWFGYLRRDGSIANTLKGSNFKGPFHLPRCLMVVKDQIEKCL